MKTVKQVLRRKGSTIHSIAPAAPVFEALEKMAAADVGALAVIDHGELVGILSERDYARKVILLGKASKEVPVRDIMSTRVVCVGPERPMDACMALMTENRVRHLPVLENDRLVGIVSIGDVVKAIIEEQQFTIEQLEHYIKGTP